MDDAGADAAAVALEPGVQRIAGEAFEGRERDVRAEIGGEDAEAGGEHNLGARALSRRVVPVDHPALPVELVARVDVVDARLGARLDQILALVDAERPGGGGDRLGAADPRGRVVERLDQNLRRGGRPARRR